MGLINCLRDVAEDCLILYSPRELPTISYNLKFPPELSSMVLNTQLLKPTFISFRTTSKQTFLAFRFPITQTLGIYTFSSHRNVHCFRFENEKFYIKRCIDILLILGRKLRYSIACSASIYTHGLYTKCYIAWF